MRDRVWLVVFVISVPAAAFLVSGLLEPACEAARRCTEEDSIRALGWWAVAAGLFGIGLVVAIWLAGRLAARNRRLLFGLFGPGLYVTMAALVAIALAHAALLAGSIYLLEVVYTGRFHPKLLLVVAVGTLWGVGAQVWGCLAALGRSPIRVLGLREPWSRNAKLRDVADTLAKKLGTPLPPNVVVGLDPTFFVTQAPVQCLTGTLTGRTLYLSLPLCRVLSVDELAGVIGHELAHFRGEDTIYSERFSPIYRATCESVHGMRQVAVEHGSWHTVSLMPAIWILEYFLETFGLAERRISRDREFAADRAAALAVGGGHIATALIKVHRVAGLWPAVEVQARETADNGQPGGNLSAAFSEMVERCRTEGFPEQDEEQRMAHPTDTHPPLEARLQALGHWRDRLSHHVFDVPVQPAIALLEHHEELEQRLSGVYHDILSRPIEEQAAA